MLFYITFKYIYFLNIIIISKISHIRILCCQIVQLQNAEWTEERVRNNNNNLRLFTHLNKLS